MTRTAKHTPGPWSINAVRNETEKLSIVDADMCFVADIWQTYVNGKSRQQDNAHLIAAAPAMYEALQALVEVFPSVVKMTTYGVSMGISKIHDNAVAALAQAEGRKEVSEDV